MFGITKVTTVKSAVEGIPVIRNWEVLSKQSVQVCEQWD